MAAVNIITSTTMYGKTAGLVVSTTPTAIVANAVSSGKLVKVNVLMVSNVDNMSSYSITADVYDGTTAYRLTPAINIPINACLDILAKSIYLEEGQSLRLTAATASKLEAVASYELVA